MNSASWIGGPNYWMASSSTWNLSARGMPISAIFFPAFFNEGARGRFRVRVQYPINLGQMSQPQLADSALAINEEKHYLTTTWVMN